MNRKKIRNIVNMPLGIFGFELIRKVRPINVAPEPMIDIDSDSIFMEMYESVKSCTMTGKEKLYAMYQATEYVLRNNIPGDIVECGVYKGGSLMLAALTAQKMNRYDKRIYAYDTYEGMTEPMGIDVNVNGLRATSYFSEISDGGNSAWCQASMEEVRANLLSTAYPEEKLVFVKGKVEETIPKQLPSQISLLRLDTDWYESTYHELTHLFPLLAPRGVIIIDDYGHWKGQRKAVDEYFQKNGICLLLQRVEYSGRMAVNI